MLNLVRSILLVAAVAVSAACATSAPGSRSLEQKLADHEFRMAGEIDRIEDYRINGWNYLDDYHVIFRAGPSDHYLLTFNQRCLNLRNAETIAFSTTVGRLTRFDKVLVRDHSGLPPERCLIERMHRLEEVT